MVASDFAEHLTSLMLSSGERVEIVVDNHSLHSHTSATSRRSSLPPATRSPQRSLSSPSPHKAGKAGIRRRASEPSSGLLSDDETEECSSFSDQSQLDDIQVKNFAEHISALFGNQLTSPAELPIVCDNHKAHQSAGSRKVHRSNSMTLGKSDYSRSLSAPVLARAQGAPYGSTDPYKKLMRWGDGGNNSDDKLHSRATSNAHWDMPALPPARSSRKNKSASSSSSDDDDAPPPTSRFGMLAEAKDSTLCLKGIKNTAARSSINAGNASWEIPSDKVNHDGTYTMPLKAAEGSLSLAKDSRLCLKGMKNKNSHNAAAIPEPTPSNGISIRRPSSGNVKNRLAAIASGSLGKPLLRNATWDSSQPRGGTGGNKKASAAVLSQLGIRLRRSSKKSGGKSPSSSPSASKKSLFMKRSNSEQRWQQTQRQSDSNLMYPKRS
jgi:hypothetical protein